MEIPMKTTIVLMSLIACSLQAADTAKTDVTYTSSRGCKATLYKITDPGAGHRMAYEGLHSAIQNLPAWLPPGTRTLGHEVYNDPAGFAHDKGHEVYTLQSNGKWKGFETLGCSYWFQGMRRESNWRMEAEYDAASGFLLRATVTTRGVGDKRVVISEVTLTNATDPVVKKKLG
jgi:hypothetical protein